MNSSGYLGLLLVLLTTAGCGGGSEDADASGGASGSGSGGKAGASGSGGVGGSGASAGAGGTGATTGGTGGEPTGGSSVGEFMGLDGFIDDPADKLAMIGNVREYHEWTWNDGNGEAGYPGYPDNQLEFSLWGGFWDFDQFYSGLDQSGVLVFPAIQGSVDYLKGALPPASSGADLNDPKSYAAHASFMFQYAARYGKTKVPDGDLKLKSGQTVASGLGLLPYFENGNEPDNNWTLAGGAPLFTPENFAAMASADYDGHQGALGATFGVKSADPGAKMVMAGLAGAGKSGDWLTDVTAYLDGIRSWADANRGGSFPADVINVHFYCFGDSQFGDTDPTPALAPEECGLRELLAGVVAYRDKNLPGKEIWLTEFGYDTHPKSRLRAPAIGQSSAEIVQGQWLTRSFLELMGSGIDRAFLFVSRDDCTGSDSKCPDNHIQFSTSGIWTEKGEEAPKPAFYFLASLRARLGKMEYAGSSDSGNPKVEIARFYDASSNQGAYVVWAPTSDGSTVSGYALAVADPIKSASIVTLANGSATGNETSASVSGGSIKLDVSESPTIVLVDGTP